MLSKLSRAGRLSRRVVAVLRSEGPAGVKSRVDRRLAFRRRVTNGLREAPPLVTVETDLSTPLWPGDGTLLRLSGWCFHPAKKVARLTALVGGGEHPVRSHG